MLHGTHISLFVAGIDLLHSKSMVAGNMHVPAAAATATLIMFVSISSTYTLCHSSYAKDIKLTGVL